MHATTVAIDLAKDVFELAFAVDRAAVAGVVAAARHEVAVLCRDVEVFLRKLAGASQRLP